MTRTTLGIALTLTMIAALVAPPSAHAGKSPLDRARASYREGQQRYDRADYQGAVTHWTRAFDLSGAPRLLFNLGQAHRLRGDCPRALRSYQRYVEAEPDGPKRAEADAFITEMQRCVARSTAPPPAKGRPVLRTTGTILLGSGLILVAAGAWFSLDAASAASEIESRYAQAGPWDDGAAAVEARGRASSERAVVLFAAGGAALVTGAVLRTLGARGGRESAIAITPSGGGVGVSWKGAW